jgi:hypothetical protein
MCTVLLPRVVNPIAVIKNISYKFLSTGKCLFILRKMARSNFEYFKIILSLPKPFREHWGAYGYYCRVSAAGPALYTNALQANGSIIRVVCSENKDSFGNEKPILRTESRITTRLFFLGVRMKSCKKFVFVKFCIADFNTTWCWKYFQKFVDRSSFQFLLKRGKNDGEST